MNCPMEYISTYIFTGDVDKISSLKIPTPKEELERVKTLRESNLNDPNYSSEQYDRFISMMIRIFKVPYALITLTDIEHAWFKSKYGTTITEVPREISFCSYTILDDSPDVFVIPDTLKDCRTSNNPFNCAPTEIRFYAGSAIVVNGHKIGAICIMDTKPRLAGLSVVESANLFEIAQCISEAASVRRRECLETEEEKLRWHKNIINLVHYPIDATIQKYGLIQETWQQFSKTILSNDKLATQELHRVLSEEAQYFEEHVNEMIVFIEKILTMIIRILYIQQIQKHQQWRQNSSPLQQFHVSDSQDGDDNCIERTIDLPAAESSDGPNVEYLSPQSSSLHASSSTNALSVPHNNSKSCSLPNHHSDIMKMIASNISIHNMIYFDVYDLELKIHLCLWNCTRLPLHVRELATKSSKRSGNDLRHSSLSATIPWNLDCMLPKMVENGTVDHYLFSHPDLILILINTVVTLCQLKNLTTASSSADLPPGSEVCMIEEGDITIKASKMLHQSSLNRKVNMQLYMLRLNFVMFHEKGAAEDNFLDDNISCCQGSCASKSYVNQNSFWSEEEFKTLSSLADVVARIGGEIQFTKPQVGMRRESSIKSCTENSERSRGRKDPTSAGHGISCLIPCYVLNVPCEKPVVAESVAPIVNLSSTTAEAVCENDINTIEAIKTPTVSSPQREAIERPMRQASSLLRGFSLASLYRQSSQSIFPSNNEETSLDHLSYTSEQEHYFSSSSLMMSLPYSLSTKLANSLRSAFFAPSTLKLTKKHLQSHTLASRNNSKVYAVIEQQDNAEEECVSSVWQQNNLEPFISATIRSKNSNGSGNNNTGFNKESENNFANYMKLQRERAERRKSGNTSTMRSTARTVASSFRSTAGHKVSATEDVSPPDDYYS